MHYNFRQSPRPRGEGSRITSLSKRAKGPFSVLLLVMSLATTGAYARSEAPPVVQLETYFSHTCALLQTGEVSCWGDRRGIGSGTLGDRVSAVPVVGINDPDSKLSGVKSLATGDANGFTCALMQSGEVACWGLNDRGQLGNLTTTDVTEFGQAVSTRPVMVRDIGGSGNLNGVKQVVVGINHSCALLQDGRVACWGANNGAQLGSDEANETLEVGSSSLPYSSVPLLVKDTSGSGVLSGVRELGGAVFHTCGLLQNGQVACWGRNSSGQLGAPTEDSRSTTPVIAHPDDPALSQVKQIITLPSATCVLSESGDVSCWGSNFRGALGDGTNDDSLTPVAVKPIGGGNGRLTGVKRLSAGGVTVCAALQNEKAACWGGNLRGGLGNGSTEASSVPVEPRGMDGIGTLGNVKQISASIFHTCALQEGNQVSCWGGNFFGELGNGTTEGSLFPKPVIDLQFIGEPAVFSPAQGSELPGSALRFIWEDNRTNAREWYFRIGSTVGGEQYASTRISDGTQRSAVFSGLPIDGSPVYVEFSYKLPSGSWVRTNQSYDAAIAPELTSPAPGSQLPGSVVTFQWASDDPAIRQFYIRVGRSPGSSEFAEQRFADPTTREYTVNGLPVDDSSTVHVQFSYFRNGKWTSQYYTYEAASSGT